MLVFAAVMIRWALLRPTMPEPEETPARAPEAAAAPAQPRPTATVGPVAPEA
jgi:hypothetical protein